ncbi:MAG: D-aminoacylase [Nitrospirae bacterium]|nr:D-aminoacylase [Nitrospirota bacterium]
MLNRADILIKNGLIYDGGLSGPFISNIAVRGDRIAHVGGGLTEAGIVIDATGFAVAPGFIDAHAHSDFTLLADPRAEGKLSQGITTEINGNCGMSAAPLFDKAAERREDDLRALGIKERWDTLEGYFGVIERNGGTGLNSAYLAGHGNIRGSVIGYDDLEASPETLSRMTALLRATLAEGAVGLSTGLIYPPGIYSDTDELVALAEGLREGDYIYTSHMRSEGGRLEEAVDEVIRIGRSAGVRAHISHIKTAGEPNWRKADAVIEKLHEARRSGLRLTCDRYPYTASSTDLDAILPSWTFAGGNSEELKRLQDPPTRKRIEDELIDQVGAAGYWNRVIVSSVESEANRWMEGKTIGLIGDELGTSGLDAFFRIIIGERLRVGAIFMSMSEDNLKKFLSLPFCMIGSDSSARCFEGPTATGKPHPRTFGTFPRVMGKYVRQERLFSLEDAVHKATMLPAETFGLKQRGRIKEGYFADIVIFDPEEITDNATFENPFQRSGGIHHVFVNGVTALSEGKLTGRRAGRVLRHGG